MVFCGRFRQKDSLSPEDLQKCKSFLNTWKQGVQLGTAGEMARLVNESGVMGDAFEATAENVKDIPFDQLIEAIHVVQTEMGITGTTAKEASETVSGSF